MKRGNMQKEKKAKSLEEERQTIINSFQKENPESYKLIMDSIKNMNAQQWFNIKVSFSGTGEKNG